MMQPTWLDGVIERVIDTADPEKIAQAIATSPDFVAAIREGLEHRPKPGTMGPSYAQNVRTSILNLLQKT